MHICQLPPPNTCFSFLFFLVQPLLPSYGKMRVPDGLEEVLEDGFLNIELLVDGNDESWFVTLLHEESDNGWKMYLDIGWSDFMDDNSLNVGDVLMFKYIGNNSFAVKIIYRTGPPQSVGARQTYGFGNTCKKRGRKPAIEGCAEKMMEANAWLDALADVWG
ncbi:putative B3 domain-containing protein At5g66980 [Chenopodium quinoa]|uniref:putative B3 domain-containing protein At5g66980 n=1 Tax=Chenopodium quinoa TaxID=63459 RepID=UPI000B78CE2D|nr:putative B3 domain-containing protein At5g66980 [Chenopodium quinoa]